MVMFVIGFIILAFANIGGIGYGLYLWGGEGMELAPAAWSAFKFWMIWMAVGLFSLIVGLVSSK